MFKKAVKTEAKLRLAIAGPAGSGKTYTALSIATHLGGPIAVIDTEHGSASKYADLFDFDVAEMHALYHPDKYLRAIKEAAEAGYKVIILDSMSHAWNGEGGLLELADEAAKAMKTQNSFAAWKSITPIQNRLVEGVVSAPLHLIATMRSKTEYVQEKDDRGRNTVRKVGMAPVQREGFEYEFDVFLDMDVEHNAIVSKTRCAALDGKVINKPAKQIADTLRTWLGTNPAPVVVAQPAAAPVEQPTHRTAPAPALKATPDGAVDVDFRSEPELMTKAQRGMMHAIGSQLFGDDWDMTRHDLVKEVTGGRTTSSSEVLKAEAKVLLDKLAASVRATMTPEDAAEFLANTKKAAV